MLNTYLKKTSIKWIKRHLKVKKAHLIPLTNKEDNRIRFNHRVRRYHHNKENVVKP